MIYKRSDEEALVTERLRAACVGTIATLEMLSGEISEEKLVSDLQAASQTLEKCTREIAELRAGGQSTPIPALEKEGSGDVV